MKCKFIFIGMFVLIVKTISAQITASDDFERSLLGNNWTIYFGGGNVGIVDSSDLGYPNNSGYFGLLGYTATSFTANQYSQIIISPNKNDSMLSQAFVRRRSSDFARYGFHWNDIGQWEIKYDGVPTAQTRILASVIGLPPQGGDTIRTEITGMTINGYWNGVLMLTATDTAFATSNPITTTGVPGIAYRWTTTFTPIFPAPVIEQWNGGDLLQTGLIYLSLNASDLIVFPNPAHNIFTIELIRQKFDVRVTDVTGRIFFEQKDITGKTEINCIDFSDGMYLVQVRNEVSILNKKLIVTRKSE